MTSMAECLAEVPSVGAEPLGGDLIKGARNASAIGILLERTTRLVILAWMEWAVAESARQGFTRKLRHVPALLRKPLTYDPGKERASTNARPNDSRSRCSLLLYSPWQRGTNENTNGLLRQYLLKGTDLSGYTQRSAS